MLRTPRRVVVVAPHPDDESIATGGLLLRLNDAGAEIRVAFLTDGENNPWPHRAMLRRWHLTDSDRARYAAIRRDEAREALSILGLPSDSARFLGFPDQGLLRLFRRNPSAISSAIERLLEDFHPDLIVAPSATDLHSDHFAAALVVRAARASYECEALAYVVHRWSRPDQSSFRILLTARERERKRRAISAHKTQMVLSRERWLRYADVDEHLIDPGEPAPVVGRSLLRCWFIVRSEIAARSFHSARPSEPARSPELA